MKNFRVYFPLAVVCALAASCSDDDAADSFPSACFGWAPTEVKVGESVQFSNCSENSVDYKWHFGDENTSDQAEPNHTYSQSGDYEVKLLSGQDVNADGVLDHMDEPDSITLMITIVE